MRDPDAAMTWAEIGARMGISAHRAWFIGTRASRKLRAALIEAGVPELLILLDQLRNDDRARQHANLTALLPPAPTTHDEADPDAHASLRSLERGRPASR